MTHRPARHERTLLAVTQDLAGGVGYVRFEQPFASLRPLGYRLRTLGTSLDLVRRLLLGLPLTPTP